MTFGTGAEPLVKSKGKLHSADLPVVEIEVKSILGYYFLLLLGH